MRSSWLADPALQTLFSRLRSQPATWLVTGAAGFIGSNLVEALLHSGQKVRGLDNFATGHRRNLEEVEALVGPDSWANFEFVEADIRDRVACESATRDIDYVLHQAALGSVPRSIADPVTTHDVNVTGFLNMLDAARRSDVKRFVYAASSSTYGDDATLPKREDKIGQPQSPYALTKLADELYAGIYALSYGYLAVGLRYFNVFGPRQDPNGPYAAVIPKWTAAMIEDDPVTIYGDGLTSRDFCFVANAVQANIRAALAPDAAQNQIYNVAVGDRTELNELFQLIRDGLSEHQIHYDRDPVFEEFRLGDIRHSQADISRASAELGYCPTHRLSTGIREALPWYIDFFRRGISEPAQ